jgi:hypothetical protein
LIPIGFTCGHLHVWHLKKGGYTRAVYKEPGLENIVEDGLKHDIVRLRVVMELKLSVRRPDIRTARRNGHGGTTSCILTELYLTFTKLHNLQPFTKDYFLGYFRYVGELLIIYDENET